jgi:hypothetical protein
MMAAVLSCPLNAPWSTSPSSERECEVLKLPNLAELGATGSTSPSSELESEDEELLLTLDLLRP